MSGADGCLKWEGRGANIVGVWESPFWDSAVKNAMRGWFAHIAVMERATMSELK